MSYLNLFIAIIVVLHVFGLTYAQLCEDVSPGFLSDLEDCIDSERGDISEATNGEKCDAWSAVNENCLQFDFTVAPECDDEVQNISTFVAGNLLGTCIAEEIESCISGDMLVLTNYGEKLVEDLKVGDMVSVGSGNFEPVVWNSQHYQKGERGNDQVRAAFIEFELEHGQKVTLTPNHYAKTTKGNVLASDIKIGHVMLTDNEQPVSVVNINKLMKQGVYNPQTPSQQIAVNGVIVSTRNKNSPAVMSIVFKALAFIQSLAPATAYSASIEFVSQYIYEPLYFGEASNYVAGTVLTILGLAVTNKA